MKTDHLIPRGFPCIHCGMMVPITPTMGTDNRNHCPFCLWSKHVDDAIPGDRASHCHAPMEPIGLTFKHEGKDKTGKIRQGELMIVHICTGCGRHNINRIAADDTPEKIMHVFETSISLPKKVKDMLTKEHIDLCDKKDTKEISIQLYGK